MQSFLDISNTQRERLAAAYSRHLEDVEALHSLEIARKPQVSRCQLSNSVQRYFWQPPHRTNLSNRSRRGEYCQN